jgi:hypothetical protein
MHNAASTKIGRTSRIIEFLLDMDCPAACPRDAANLPDFLTQVQHVVIGGRSPEWGMCREARSLGLDEDFDAYVKELCEFFCLRFADRSLAVKNLGGNALRSKHLSKIFLR